MAKRAQHDSIGKFSDAVHHGHPRAQRLAHLQRFADIRFSLSPSNHVRRLDGRALLWHFAAMGLLFFNEEMYLFLNISSGHFKARFFRSG
jgi:thiosulfate reductase cytochrome b subunit